MGTGRGTGAQRGLALDDERRPQGDLVDGPLDGVLPLPAGRARRAAWLVAPVWHVGFAVLSVLGAVHAGHAGTVAPLAATMLYATAGALFTAVAATLVALRVQGTRGGGVPLAPVRAAYLTTPVASAVLLSAAYVTRLGGGPFFGGFGAMVALTVALVMLAQRTTELRLGSAGPVSERRTPTAPVAVVGAVPAAAPVSTPASGVVSASASASASADQATPRR
ncbi:hypothetical protein ES689_14635 [Frigoribacterium sp. ACAM 257]|uniref:hypothetical protein n=1 Tax=Frigoribacterium sp. ACAM 257 TaxID=2508998 RepID=UPI0011B9AD63|nr:hypothetical protein [Frigoribacterium sp. ACAM 257]TWX34548.1 hypothetical protein ES689_14635 [Frigoribacterium sp. ACAM 257]